MEKLDGTLLTREIAKSTKLHEKDPKLQAKFGAPKEYRPPLGAANSNAQATKNAMRGANGLGPQQYRMKHQHQAALNKNGSKVSLPPSQLDIKPDLEPYSNSSGTGSKNQQQRAQKRNSDLKKNNQSMLGYLAGTALTGQGAKGTKSNPSNPPLIRGAFGTGYKRC